MRVESVMTPEPLTIRPDASIYDAMTLMMERDIRHLPVVDSRGELVGMISDRDLRRFSLSLEEDQSKLKERLRADVMQLTHTDVVTVTTEDEVKDAIDEMLEAKVGALPVVDAVDSSRLAGILSYVDILRAWPED